MKVLFLVASALFVCAYSYGQNISNTQSQAEEAKKELAEIYVLEDSLARLKTKKVLSTDDNDRIPIVTPEDIAAGLRAGNGKKQLSKSPAGQELIDWELQSRVAACVSKNGGSPELSHNILKGQKYFEVSEEKDKRALEQCGFKKVPKKKEKTKSQSKSKGKNKVCIRTSSKSNPTITCGTNPQNKGKGKQGTPVCKKRTNAVKK